MNRVEYDYNENIRDMAYPRKEYRKTRTIALGSAIDSVLVKYRLFDGVLLSKLAAEKEVVFGKHFGSHLTPVEFKDGVLKLKFDNDAWRHEAKLCQGELLKLCNEHAQGKVKKLYFL